MKYCSFLLLVALLIPALSYAQPGNQRGGGQWHDEASTLSVFSENGEPFFLVLNGINQNNMPASKIRVEGLPQYGNDIEILFTDKVTPAIRKRITIADPVDGKAVNMVLKIERNREGYARLKFHKCSEVEHDYRPERDEYVMSYGNSRETIAARNEQTYTRPPAGPVAMDARTFDDAKKSIKGASFDETKLSTAKTILGSNYVNTNQVIEICKLLSYDDSKLDFAKFAYSKTVDVNNYFKVGNVFGFSSNKEALNEFINAGGK
jgi:hypothetical protein